MQRSIWFVLPLLAIAAFSQGTEKVGGDYAEALNGLLSERFEATRVQRDKAVAGLTTRDAVLARQRLVREAFVKGIGGLPTEKTPLNAKVTGKVDRDGYVIEKVIFESLPGFRVTANLYLPKTGKAPFPAMLGTAGHAATGKGGETYQSVWQTLARRGVAVFAFDPPGQGERYEYLDPKTGKSTVGAGVAEHNMTGMQCLLTGQSIAPVFLGVGRHPRV
ncbi:MAG: hypothetical protein U5J83_06355 [Bryobacterales bacterium]|nr:hypothetical protein [Bryobacterales bacterium]